MQKKTLVISDLHIFSPASSYARHSEHIHQLIKESEVCILNGDIFDFKRSTIGSVSETIPHASRILDSMLSANLNCKFHYILGNQEYIEMFLNTLKDLPADRFQVHPDILRIEDKIFLHGDIATTQNISLPITETRTRLLLSERDELSAKLARIIVALRLNLVAYLTHSKEQIASRIYQYLALHYKNDLILAKEIYFGHTHVPFNNFELNGIKFFNTGSTIKNMRFEPIVFT